jgi:hypothetical protein
VIIDAHPSGARPRRIINGMRIAAVVFLSASLFLLLFAVFALYRPGGVLVMAFTACALLAIGLFVKPSR